MGAELEDMQEAMSAKMQARQAEEKQKQRWRKSKKTPTVLLSKVLPETWKKKRARQSLKTCRKLCPPRCKPGKLKKVKEEAKKTALANEKKLSVDEKLKQL